jgi:DNA repair protein RadC
MEPSQSNLQFWTVAELVQELKIRSKQTTKVKSPIDAYTCLFNYRNRKQEHFFVLHLDGNHRITMKEIVSIGLLNRTLVHPREIFSSAVKRRAAAIVIAHNHPSGNTEPSSEDDEISNRLYKAGELLGIGVLDHIIFGKHGYYSYLEDGREPLGNR